MFPIPYTSDAERKHLCREGCVHIVLCFENKEHVFALHERTAYGGEKVLRGIARVLCV